jgi:indolepyruvate ferredoxin oxidoreductase alpha subunit
LLTGNEALARGLTAAHIRSAWSFPGSPLTKLEMMLDARSAQGVTHRFTVNEHVAASLALGGGLLSGHGSCMLMKHVGVNVALDTLATFGVVNELRSPVLIVEGVDPGPVTSQNAQDNRATLSGLVHLLQLEAGSPDEAYQLTRLGAQLSLRTGMPVLLRVHERALSARGEVSESPPDLPERAPTTFRARRGPSSRRRRRIGSTSRSARVDWLSCSRWSKRWR